MRYDRSALGASEWRRRESGALMLAAEWNLGSVLWAMVAFMFWIMAIWLFIALFTDIFRRKDISGAAKAGWILLIFILPLIGSLIYISARPNDLEPGGLTSRA